VKRLLFIYLFLHLIFSCGNSGGKTNAIPSVKLPNPPVLKHEEISAEQKLTAYRFDTLFKQLHKAGQFNGSVLIAREGKVLYQNAMGFSDKENNILLNDSSRLQLASVSKVITATAVLMLYEQGLIKLEATFKTYFPEFPYGDVTVQQLLSHRSGLPNYIYVFNEDIARPNYKMNNEEVMDLFCFKQPKPYLKPDTRFHYCNSNYALLALLVSKISGMSFKAFLQTRIFNPIGMKHTGTILDLDSNNQDVAKPYNLKWQSVAMDASDYVLGDKSIYSTPYDLFLFSEALYQNTLLKAETQNLAYQPYSKEKKLSNYGLGWRMRDFEDTLRKEVYHNGWWHGYRTAFHRRLKDKVTIVVLSNQLNRAAYHTWKVYQILDNVSEIEVAEEEE
jgi:CubicO group peptidase (beta-lactamase class C family)